MAKPGGIGENLVVAVVDPAAQAALLLCLLQVGLGTVRMALAILPLANPEGYAWRMIPRHLVVLVVVPLLGHHVS
jgi:hypothetical protein